MDVKKALACGIGGLVAALVLGVAAPPVFADDTTPSPIPSPSPSPSTQQPPVAPVIVAARPLMTGTTKVGYELAVTTPGWTPGVSFSYAWLRNGVAIKRATSGRYWLTKADQGKRVAVTVTATLPGATARSQSSASAMVGSSTTGKKLTKPFTVKGVWVISKDHRVAKSHLKKGKGVLGSNKTASDALKKLMKAARKAGYTVRPSWGYRSFSTQKAIWKRNVKALGKKRGEQFAAPPGASEHNAGLAFDLRSGSKGRYAFGSSKAGRWVAKNAWKYGFILRYPKGRTKITGYAYEPWHFRYIGTEHSKAFAGHTKLTLEEYLGLA